ncbi:MAG: RNA methyltransferase [Bdellovibrionales bacterium]|nr:RNA methyltransferase [Bdellovibrionales bacterium]
MAVPVYVVLLHYPVTNRNGEVITTAFTNLDIHDISRSCRTYSVRGYTLVSPVAEQHEVAGRILEHWKSAQAREYHPDRAEALSCVELALSFEEVVERVQGLHGERPEIVLTEARPLYDCVSYEDFRRELERPGRTRPVVLVFGTGWGIDPSFSERVDRVLVPLYGPEGREGYNHLSVRAAAAIILDRLLGMR